MKNYQLIDYSRWDFSGRGKNLSSLLNDSERKIWDIALPFQDKRQDIGHGESVAYSALQLLNYSSANREIIVPAAILHDTGWSQVSERDRIESSAERLSPEENRRVRLQHEEEGVKLAINWLNQLNYDSELITPILKIIGRHDTGKEISSVEEGLVKDADKLYRFLVKSIQVNIERDGFSLDKIKERSTKWIKDPEFFYSPEAREIAKIEFENSLKFL